MNQELKERIKQMKEENKKEYTGTRDEIISQGYSACKNCDPQTNDEE